jgi:hypothetical protein
MNNYNTANYLHHVINFKSKTMKHTRNIFALITCLLLATMLSDTFATDWLFQYRVRHTKQRDGGCRDFIS